MAKEVERRIGGYLHTEVHLHATLNKTHNIDVLYLCIVLVLLTFKLIAFEYCCCGGHDGMWGLLSKDGGLEWEGNGNGGGRGIR